MATLVTGGTGFVGANIVKKLAEAGHETICFDLNGPDQLMRDFVAEVAEQVTFVEGDILDWAALDRLRQTYSIDKIVHAAVFTGTRPDIELERRQEIVDINITGTVNLLELARVLQPIRFIYVSSGAVYGTVLPEDQPLYEDGPTFPQNLYAITKYTSELLTRRYGQLHGFSTASVRLSTPYGPMERVTGQRAIMSVPYNWTRNVMRGEAIQPGDLSQGRDYTYVSDIADGIRAVLDAPTLPHDLYNITTGVWLTFRDILAKLRELFPNTKIIEANVGGAVSDSREPSRGPLSGYRLNMDLGWKPQFDLSAGLADYLRWRRQTPFLD